MEEFSFFTPEQKAEIKKILRAYSPDFIDCFIDGVDFYCYEFSGLNIPHVEQARHKVRDRQAGILADVRQTITHLKAFAAGIEKGAVPGNLEDAIFAEDKHTAAGDLKDHEMVNFILREAAQKALPALVQFEYLLDGAVIYNKGAPGRPRPIAVELIGKIAWFFDLYLGPPTNYREGPFFGVTQYVLEVNQLPAQNPTRQIREALKKHRKKRIYRFRVPDQLFIKQKSRGVYSLDIGDENP